MRAVTPTSPILFNTPVLFLVFNRPDVTRQVFETIRQVKPPRLYVAADGPRKDKTGEMEKVQAVRNHILKNIDWDCRVETLFRDSNRGCKRAVSEAITWFFDQEEQGIILEDDCLPHPDYFPFCQELLERYADDKRVSVITGDNFQNGIVRGNASYYFSKYNHCWGWATWRRSWGLYKGDISFWPDWKNFSTWKRKLPDRIERRYWEQIFDRVYKDEIDSWAYPWTACVWYRGGLTATPNVNLVSNIGFGENSTHTADSANPLSNKSVQSIGKISHPKHIHQYVIADRYVFNYHFGGSNMRWYNVLLRYMRRAIGKLIR